MPAIQICDAAHRQTWKVHDLVPAGAARVMFGLSYVDAAEHGVIVHIKQSFLGERNAKSFPSPTPSLVDDAMMSEIS
ncbi:hypothetical protein [Rhodococcus sp. IEGM1428]|uniref:hypothetical protein n=1 Tax=Rhodococcus sp. IEGM1428 TaxID=3392191 RepID=UPI003D112644